MGQSGLGHDAPCFPFFAVGPGGSGQAEGADEGRKRDALQHERDEDDAEGEKDDQIPLRKRAAVGQRAGRARAAARETTPRMPVQPMTKISRGAGALPF